MRPSQFVLVYGPGAILETNDGPRMIPEAEEGLFLKRNINNIDLRIIDERMSSGLLDGAEIFRLPSKSELTARPNEYLYLTKPFPVWRLCTDPEHGAGYILHENATGRCPVCGKGRAGAIRFVSACSDGHLDEVNWNYVVHRGAKCGGVPKGASGSSGRDSFFYWTEGGTVSSTVLQCPKCLAKSKFGEVYYGGFGCTGRHPQREKVGSRPRRTDCGKKAKIIQRQASSLRIPEVKTLFSIGPVVTNLHILLSDRAVKVALHMYQNQSPRNDLPSKNDLLNLLENNRRYIPRPEKTISEVRNSDEWEIRDALQYAAEDDGHGFEDLLKGEFRELVKASKKGAPPLGSRHPRSRIQFEVDPNRIDTARGPAGTKFSITPIKRLRTVTVQTGFRRAVKMEEDDAPSVVDIDYLGDSKRYPGVEFLGEGIFIRLDDSDGGAVGGAAAGKWSSAKADMYKDRQVFRDPSGSCAELDPVFVWWHTLSHALIRTISEYAGYSSSSIRERIYLGGSAGKKIGGMIMYATQPGNDGTMGGLISLVPHFESVLGAAMERIDSCSGDPLCWDQRFGSMKLNGAACYGCVMNSETSCEHRNMWLDRRVLVENMP